MFCQIDEKPFACLYCADNGRPNFPVNILLSLEFIKQLKNYTDEELIDQFYFNYQVSYAVGLHCLGEIQLLERFLNEQSDFDAASGHRVAKKNSAISPNSLQSADDPDATYREKGGKKHKGYVANLIETCNQDNPVQLVTDYHLAANTTSDVELLKERLPILKENMPVQHLYADGGYYGEEALQLAPNTDVNLHFTNMTGRKKSSDKLPLTDFDIDEENYRIITCPAGHAPLRSGRAKRSGSITAHFDRQHCQACPDKDRCPVKFQKKSAVLRVTSKALYATRTRIQLEDRASRREATSKRAAIEGTNSALKRGHGAAKLAVRTQAKSQTVFGLKVIGHNFRQFVRGLIIMAGRQTQDSEAPALSGSSLCFCSWHG